VQYRQVRAGQRWHDEKQDGKQAARQRYGGGTEPDAEQELAAVRPQRLAEGDACVILGRHEEHRATDRRLHRRLEADEEHRAVEQRRVGEVTTQAPRGHGAGVEQQVVQNRGHEDMSVGTSIHSG
jgi:hypothetical protein